VLSPGTQAPDFELPSSDGELVRLSEVLKGSHVVLYFYPKDNSPGCTIEACGFRDRYDEIVERGAVVLGVSPGSPESIKRFKTKLNLPFTILSDREKKVARLYDALIGGLLVKRVTYVIARDGVIIHAYGGALPQRHIEEALEALQSRL